MEAVGEQLDQTITYFENVMQVPIFINPVYRFATCQMELRELKTDGGTECLGGISRPDREHVWALQAVGAGPFGVRTCPDHCQPHTQLWANGEATAPKEAHKTR